MSVSGPSKQTNASVQEGAVPPTELPLELPAELPPRPLKSRRGPRMCPGYNGSMPSQVAASYSLRTNGDTELRFRRLGAILVLALRTFSIIGRIIIAGFGFRVLDIVFRSVYCIVGFFLVAYWLHQIADMRGTRIVLGFRVNKWAYDAFLFIMAILHGGMVLLGILRPLRGIFDEVWLVLGFLIFLAAWPTKWDPVPVPVSLP